MSVQLSGGVLVVRRLRCGLLFVCIGPVGETTTTATTTTTMGTAMGVGIGAGVGVGEGGSIAAGQREQQGSVPTQEGGNTNGGESPSQVAGSPSEGDSVLSAGSATTGSNASGGSATTTPGVVLMRRQVEELARWLDDKLGSLKVPEDGVGTE